MKREATLYDILEVSPNASDLVIKAAYRSLAQHNHPDKNAGAEAAGERLAQINHAYSVLSDALTRARYDRTIDLVNKSFERRGGGMTTYDRSESNGAGHKGSRPFVFRHLF